MIFLDEHFPNCRIWANRTNCWHITNFDTDDLTVLPFELVTNWIDQMESSSTLWGRIRGKKPKLPQDLLDIQDKVSKYRIDRGLPTPKPQSTLRAESTWCGVISVLLAVFFAMFLTWILFQVAYKGEQATKQIKEEKIND